MAKLTLTNIDSTESTSIIAAINSNNDLIEAALENTLSRDGTAPNELQAGLDANSQALYNLREPVLDNEAARKSYVDDLVGSLNQDALDSVIQASADAVAAKVGSEVARDQAEVYRDEAASFVGAATSAQKLSTPRTFSFTGDGSGTSAGFDGQANLSLPLTISNQAVTNSKLALVPSATFKANVGGAAATPQDVTGAQAAEILPAYGGAVVRGLVVGLGTGTTRFLREDGTFATPPYPAAVVPNQGSYTTSGSVQIGDMIRKWGQYTTLSTTETGYGVFFPVIFPNACTDVQLTTWYPGSTSGDQWAQLASYDRNGFTFVNQRTAGAATTTMKISWVAWGY